MSCPSSGGDGRGTDMRPARMRPRFYPTGSSRQSSAAGEDGERVLIETEGRDVSEQQFAASLDAPGSMPRFVPDGPGSRPYPAKSESSASEPVACGEAVASSHATGEEAELIAAGPASPEVAVQTIETEIAGLETPPEWPAEAAAESMNDPAAWTWSGDEDSVGDEPQWRQEVAARLHNYHSRRRKKPPRYPSLALKFDPPIYPSLRAGELARSTGSQPPARSESATAAAAAPEFAAEAIEEPRSVVADTTNVIEFPRPLVPPPPRPDELAEPMLDLPRILDAPETVPKQVPLGGIILEPEPAPAASDLELPLRVAPLGRRVLAAGLDGVLVGLATLLFVVVAGKIAPLLPSARVLLSLGVALPAILWAAFQYIFLVYTGSTPGMRVIGLQLKEFEGGGPDRGTRRWRALAMALSAVSLGLGFLWCLLDEDTLCWHDRITRTYLDAGPVADSDVRQGPVFPERLFVRLRRLESFLQRRAEETCDEPDQLQH
jgi:uncharacterized RDD family membrane protein YckC